MFSFCKHNNIVKNIDIFTVLYYIYISGINKSKDNNYFDPTQGRPCLKMQGGDTAYLQ